GHLKSNARDLVQAAVKQAFRPEFINRLDDMVIFNPLGRDHLRSIVRLQVEDLSQRLDQQGITLTIDQAATDHILAESWDPTYGARPMSRFIEHNVGTELSRMIIAGELASRQSVHITADQDLLYQVGDSQNELKIA
ncbi:MAG: type VI secretion system ATPase TssH, partial [Sphaerospermopsis sp. SIO1G2]|nr:type VI secretion system ATPase TssH [Sphaerospermopsis sp. SIO1G2]